MRTLRVDSPEDRDMTADELNGKWAVDKLHELANQSADKPFFMGVGFIRPHTPLIVPERFFKQFPLDSIQLPVIRPGDVDDTHARSVRGIPAGKEPDSERTDDMGSRLFTNLVASYDSQDEALRRFIQAYLASVASVDELIGQILDAIDHPVSKDNTIIILTSDHGWGMGEKDYLYKNSLWQESTQSSADRACPGHCESGRSGRPAGFADRSLSNADRPVRLDRRNKEERQGASARRAQPEAVSGGSRNRPVVRPRRSAYRAYKWATFYDPAEQSYSLRSKDWRYIRYSNGKEELYHYAEDPYEWTNLADNPEYASDLNSFRESWLPGAPTRIPARRNPPTNSGRTVSSEVPGGGRQPGRQLILAGIQKVQGDG